MNYSEKMETSAVQAHISMLQGIINRMSANSANCKTWTIAIITALLVFIADENNSFNDIRICAIPILLFYMLDSFYLGIERYVINQQKEVLDKARRDEDYVYSMFILKKQDNRACATLDAMFSFSTMPFYALLSALMMILNNVI